MTFTASNGIGVKFDAKYVDFDTPGRPTSPIWFRSEEALALREFFQHERDKELGRWRYDKNTVVYPSSNDENCVTVVSELWGQAVLVHRHRSEGVHPDWRVPAGAYFERYPESKPWDDAEEGEVWAFKFCPDTVEVVWYLKDDRWHGTYLGGECSKVTARQAISGRRIYPEGDEE